MRQKGKMWKMSLIAIDVGNGLSKKSKLIGKVNKNQDGIKIKSQI